MGHQIEVGGLAELDEVITSAGYIEPRCEEAGCLGTLARTDNDDHLVILPSTTLNPVCESHEEYEDALSIPYTLPYFRPTELS
ncbi:protein of unknown function [Agreia sp. COWG]|nr:protein of unknown function [Agreia sp. COWG]